jgi:hypothetical protein
MEVEGIVRDGVAVPLPPHQLQEGEHVRIMPSAKVPPTVADNVPEFNGVLKDPLDAKTEAATNVQQVDNASDQGSRPFGERYPKYQGSLTDLPEDFAAQHDHYRLGTPKR